MKTFTIILTLLIAVVINPVTTLAQPTQILSEKEILLLSPAEQDLYIKTLPLRLSNIQFSDPADNANCFDYYHFGSVQVQLDGNLNKIISGTSLEFTGNIINQNNYPIIDGAVYAKIFRKQVDGDLVHANGHNLVDQLFVAESLTLPAQSETPFDFMWQIPAYAKTGDYQIAFFFTSAKKFNLLGLLFTDVVVGDVFDFLFKENNQEEYILIKIQ